MTSEIDPLALGVVFDFAPAVAQLDSFYANIQKQLQKSFDVKIAAPKMPTVKATTGFDDNKIAGVGLALANVAERAAKAEISLERYAAAGSKTALAEATFRAQSVEIQRLTQLTGNAELGARAMAGAQAQLAAATAPVVESYDGLGEALARVAAASEQAEAQLMQMAAAGSRSETLQLNYAKQAKEIERLGELSGNTTLAAKAHSVAQQKLAKDLAAAATASSRTSTQVQAVGVSTGATAAGIGQLGQQLADVAIQMEMGANPFTILIQQGPQVASAIQMGGGAATMFQGVLGAGKAILASYGMALGVVAVALAGLATAYAVVANATYDATEEQAAFNAESEQTESRAAAMADALREVTEAQKGTRDAFGSSKEQIAVTTGLIEDYELAAAKAADRVRKGAQEEIQARTEAMSLAAQQIRKAEEIIASQGSSDEASVAARKERARLLVVQREQTAGVRALVEETDREAAALFNALIAAGQAKDAEEKLKKARDAGAKAAKEEADRIKALAEARAKLQEAETDAANAGLTGAAEIAARRQEELETLREIRDEALLLVKTEQERLALIADYTGASVAVERKFNNERAESYTDALNVIKEKAAEARKAQLTGIEEVKAARQDEISVIYKTQAEVLALADTDEERLNAYKAADEARGEAERRYMQQLKKLAEEQKQIYIDIGMTVLNTVGSMADMVTGRIMSAASSAAQEAAGQVAELTRMIESLGSSTVNAAGLSGDALVDAYREGKVAAGDLSKSQKQYIANTLYAEKKAAEEREDAQKKSALAAFRIQKGIAIAIATINAIMGVSQAAGSAPPPANIPAIIAATATGAANIAAAVAVPAPKFHSGTLYVDGPSARGLDASEVPAILQRGEAVVSRQAMRLPGARQAVQDIQQGRIGGGIGAGDVAAGMDSSSVPGLLKAVVGALQRLPSLMPQPKGSGVDDVAAALARRPAERVMRPGHRMRYA